MQLEWGGVFEQWARRWVARNQWRVAHTVGGREDCMQECALIFTRCHNRYADKVDNPAWFMALFKVAVSNTWILLSKRDSRARRVKAELEARAPRIKGATLRGPGSGTELAHAPIDEHMAAYNDGPLLAALREGSDELRCVLETIANAPAEALSIMFGGKNAKANNIRLRRFCQLPGRPEVLSELRELLSANLSI